jgi:hypothetical protein
MELTKDPKWGSLLEALQFFLSNALRRGILGKGIPCQKRTCLYIAELMMFIRGEHVGDDLSLTKPTGCVDEKWTVYILEQLYLDVDKIRCSSGQVIHISSTHPVGFLKIRLCIMFFFLSKYNSAPDNKYFPGHYIKEEKL